MRNPALACSIVLLSIFLCACQEEEFLFTSVPPSHSGIHFSNQIIEDDTFNILACEYVYNGGGVGIGDFNGDGLADVYFTGNMSSNKLYLNQGEFRFADVTEQAGVASSDQWNSGVAVIDINNDGWLDLYVCATLLEPSSRRVNRLFINQGVTKEGEIEVPTFTEQATAYGLADASHSTNAAFFDYDNDGDLDLYVLVNQMDENAVPSHFRKIISDGSSHRTDKLFRNDFDESLGHPVFTDVSAEAGISVEGYGLGLNICDINQDGWKDIYVTNDYLTNDLFWINQGKTDSAGVQFVNKASSYLKHTSYSAMGNNVGDINNDGLADIVAVDMLPEDNLRRKTMLGPNNYMFYVNNERLGYQYQYVRNTLQLNQGFDPQTQEPIFSEIGMQAGISSTDWSWTPLLADFDNDSKRDLLITNGFPKDVTDRDFMEFSRSNRTLVAPDQLESRIPTIKIKNYAYRNALSKNGGIPLFENVTQAWGLAINSFSNGAAYADLDLDGDLDLIINNINDSAFVYRNTLIEQSPKNNHWLRVQCKGSSTNLHGLGSIVEIFYENGQTQIWENTPYRGYLSSVEAGAHFGLGTVDQLDSLVITWQEGFRQVIREVAVNQLLEVRMEDALPVQPDNQISLPPSLFQEITDSVGMDYTHRESDFIDFNVQRLLLHKFSQYGPGLAVSDVNGDGLEDVYVGGSRAHKGQFFLQQTNGQFVQTDLLPGPNGNTKQEEELGILFFDADNDQDQDLYLVSGSYELDSQDSAYQDRFFLNEGGKFVLAENALPPFRSSGSCVRAADVDRDGDLDLFVGGRLSPSQYPVPVSSYLLINDGKGRFQIGNDVSAPALNDLGLISDALWTDFDNDGWVDLMLAGEWMPVQFLHNQNGTLIPHPTPKLSQAVGFWNSLAAADFDLDGDMDYVVGNLGSNTLLKASDEHPISLYYGDFYANQASPSSQKARLDAIPSAYFPDTQGKLTEFPFFGKTDMEKQLIAIKRLYLYHQDYAQASMLEILQQFPQVKSEVLQANHLLSTYIENLGDGTFAIHTLPAEAQTAPIFGMIASDVNGDALPDLFLLGNDYGGEIGMGRYDALNGLILLNEGQGNFVPLSLQESGICVPGDAKSLVSLQSSSGQPLFLASQNRGPLKIFRQSSVSPRSIPLPPSVYAAIVHLQDGRSYREEIPYGSGFLSQSGRWLRLPVAAASYELIDFQGNRDTESAGEGSR